MTGATRIAKSAFDILTVIFAIIGALSIIVVLIGGGLFFWAVHADRKPLEWPSATRECLAVGGKPLGDAQLLALAEQRWSEDDEREGEAYRRKYVGGPVLPAQSHVERRTVTPSAGEVYVAEDLELQSDIDMRYRLAHQGLRQFALVTLALSPPLNPDHSVQAKTAERVYIFDLCGAALE